MRKGGVVLSWTPEGEGTAVRLQAQATDSACGQTEGGLAGAAPEPVEQNLLVEAGAHGHALDKSVRFGETYEYRAQRVIG